MTLLCSPAAGVVFTTSAGIVQVLGVRAVAGGKAATASHSSTPAAGEQVGEGRHSDPLARPALGTEERLLAKTDRETIHVPHLGACWTWLGTLKRDGYGTTSIDGRFGTVHRLAYERYVGPIPEGLEIDHLCRNRACCNPAHLEPVTRQEHARRGVWATRTHCAYGHELAGDNLIIRPEGSRRCRECKRRRAVEYRQRKAAA